MITKEDLFEVASLAYSRWAREFDALKAVKAEVDDGSDDWEMFHQHRLKHHTEVEAKWRGLKDRLIAAQRQV